MKVFNNFYYRFSQYAIPTERKVGTYFSKLNENKPKASSIKALTSLMQDNIVVLNLWSEYKYKGYEYLTKNKRKELYHNVDVINADFNQYLLSNHININSIYAEIDVLGLSAEKYEPYHEKLVYIKAIMDYLSPKRGIYSYRESSTFGELLKDPKKDQLVGDCNQMVTLYIYLYSLKYNITDLQLITYPGHVALHFEGLDIETTYGQFKKYHITDQSVLPIQEIISINLLDTTDTYFKTHKISPNSYLQSARLAYLVSSNQSIISNNLSFAYSNIVNDLLKANDYNRALKYAKQSGDKQLLNTVAQNGAILYMNKNSFKHALTFAAYAINNKALINKIHHNYGVYLYGQGDYGKAINEFKTIGNNELIQKCYIGLYANEQKNLGNLRSDSDIKNNRSTINKMHNYAKKSGSKKLLDYTTKLKEFI